MNPLYKSGDTVWPRPWGSILGYNIEQAAFEEMRVRAAVERLRGMLAQKTVVCSPGRPVFPGFPWDSLDWGAWGY